MCIHTARLCGEINSGSEIYTTAPLVKGVAETGGVVQNRPRRGLECVRACTFERVFLRVHVSVRACVFLYVRVSMCVWCVFALCVCVCPRVEDNKLYRRGLSRPRVALLPILPNPGPSRSFYYDRPRRRGHPSNSDRVLQLGRDCPRLIRDVSEQNCRCGRRSSAIR